MSNKKKLMTSIGSTIMQWQDACEVFDEAFSELCNLSSVERRCLGFVSQKAQTASAISKQTRLTPAAVTTLLDRLESRGLVKRQPDVNDRRKVLVEVTEKTQQLIFAAYGPIAKAGADLLNGYTIDELVIIKRFLEGALSLQVQMTDELFKRKSLE